ncbi:phage holin family protein [Tsuneonella sp. SYSU-LHT278]|uniref:phage holin family protein n=1 Tax=Tsuneonella sediminis TaxID=3416089 RepID=UPI003F7B14E2
MNTHDPDFEHVVETRSVDEDIGARDSLTDDIVALLDDGRTMVEAEIQFQRTRAAFALDRGRAGAFYGVVAFALIHLALVALVVGLVIALSPIIGPWAATAGVVGVLIVAGLVLAMMARRRFARLARAYSETRE